MGDYEDRYPDAYGRGEEKPLTPGDALRQAQTGQQVRDSKLSESLRQRVGLETPDAAATQQPAPSAEWRHAPDETPGTESRTIEPRTIEPTIGAGPVSAPPVRPVGDYRGVGPRGYARSPARIHEDICDRLTENPFVDASNIEVQVTGGEVLLRGTVDNAAALQQANEIARETAGVTAVLNELTVRAGAGAHGSTAGDQVNRAMGSRSR
ncbi:MAG: BON domain-containing protein [Alphaproteobacteria bacterium]|nr:BON domain-containing protein [Alphaproteobacteria bacterium]